MSPQADIPRRIALGSSSRRRGPPALPLDSSSHVAGIESAAAFLGRSEMRRRFYFPAVGIERLRDGGDKKFYDEPRGNGIGYPPGCDADDWHEDRAMRRAGRIALSRKIRWRLNRDFYNIAISRLRFRARRSRSINFASSFAKLSFPRDRRNARVREDRPKREQHNFRFTEQQFHFPIDGEGDPVGVDGDQNLYGDSGKWSPAAIPVIPFSRSSFSSRFPSPAAASQFTLRSRERRASATERFRWRRIFLPRLRFQSPPRIRRIRDSRYCPIY